MEAVDNNQKSEIMLSSSDINNIYLKGIPVDKRKVCIENLEFHPIASKYENEYFYFEVQNKGVKVTQIRYPSLMGKDGVFTKTYLMKFEMNGVNIKYRRMYIESNGRDLNFFYSGKCDSFFPLSEGYKLSEGYNMELLLSDSSLLFMIFGVMQTPYDSEENIKDKSLYQYAKSIIKKISYIKVVDDFLVIKA